MGMEYFLKKIKDFTSTYNADSITNPRQLIFLQNDLNYILRVIGLYESYLQFDFKQQQGLVDELKCQLVALALALETKGEPLTLLKQLKNEVQKELKDIV